MKKIIVFLVIAALTVVCGAFGADCAAGFEYEVHYGDSTEDYNIAEESAADGFISELPIIAVITVAVSVITAFVYTGILKKQLKSVENASNANNYIVENSLNITRSYDRYLYSNTTRTKISSSKK